MKRIGLLGGTSWPSTIDYYRRLNQLAAQKLGGHHSADLLLRSIDYHDIKSCYGARWDEIPALLGKEMKSLLACGCDAVILCNNTLHKAFDTIASQLAMDVPFFHAVELTAQHALREGKRRLLLLATKFTMEDGFFAHILQSHGLEVTLPTAQERDEIQAIQSQLAQDTVKAEFNAYFRALLARYSHLDGVVLACTELPMVIGPQDTSLAVINPVELQCRAAMEFATA